MYPHALEARLRSYTPQEIQHLGNIFYDYSRYPVAGYYHGTPFYSFEAPSNQEELMLENNVRFEHAHLGIIKQNRFEEVPLHIHDWIELNYMYSGSCVLTINDNQEVLHKGQMCLIDTNAPHSVSRCGEDDILINFLIEKDYLNSAFFQRLAANNYLTNFFIETLNQKANHDNYIVFHSENSDRLPIFLALFLCEYYDASIGTVHILDSLMTLILCELINIFENDITAERHNTPDRAIIPIIRYIERNYNNCTLESTAAYFNMHPNYLSAYIKKHTQKNFKELIQTQRLQQAAELLKNSSLSTNDICIHVGYQNNSFFFHKFREYYGCSPKEYRSIYREKEKTVL